MIGKTELEAIDAQATGPSGASLWRRIDRADLVRTLFVDACAVAVALGLTWPWPPVPVLALVGIVVGCWPIAREAFEDVRHRRMSMEASMLIAIVAAAAIGEWTTSLGSPRSSSPRRSSRTSPWTAAGTP